ncbi:hypothetical protein Ptr902_09747 [Pyrenophora tritici-repentis]|nr:hypothetical protein Ptr902_09747 [Pyrenophora tritici-repentis]
MPSTSTDPLPTFTISPPPLLLPSAHITTIETVPTAISAVITTLILALLVLSFTNKHNANSTANKSEPEPTPRRLRISGPLGLEQQGDITLQHIPNNTTKPPLYDEGKWLSGTLNELQMKTFDNPPLHLPSQQTPLYPAYTTTQTQSPIGLDTLHPATTVSKPRVTYHRDTQPLPASPAQQFRQTMTIPRRPLPLASEFGDGSTVWGSKQDKGGLREDFSFEDDELGSREVGLLGRHWE